MKSKILLLTLLFCLLLPAYAIANTASFTIGSTQYIINGETKTMDVAPYTKDDRTYLPVRFLAEALGVKNENITWDEQNQTIKMNKWDKVVQIKVNSNIMILNRNEISMDVVPEVNNDRVFLPLRWLANGFKFNINYDSVGQKISLDNRSDGNIEEQYISTYKPYANLLLKFSESCVKANSKIEQGYDVDPQLAEIYNLIKKMKDSYKNVSIPENHKESAFYLDAGSNYIVMAILDARLAIDNKKLGNDFLSSKYLNSSNDELNKFADYMLKSANAAKDEFN